MCESGSIRLANGDTPFSGRVEVCNEEAWGTVCDDSWTQADANVACLQAGFSRFGEIHIIQTQAILLNNSFMTVQ